MVKYTGIMIVLAVEYMIYETRFPDNETYIIIQFTRLRLVLLYICVMCVYLPLLRNLQ
jgi:hypothetical protein